MDSDGRYVQEYTKYSFLLGSALRNEDPEQFLSIYDSLLPCNLPDIQVKSHRVLWLASMKSCSVYRDVNCSKV